MKLPAAGLWSDEAATDVDTFHRFTRSLRRSKSPNSNLVSLLPLPAKCYFPCMNVWVINISSMMQPNSHTLGTCKVQEKKQQRNTSVQFLSLRLVLHSCISCCSCWLLSAWRPLWLMKPQPSCFTSWGEGLTIHPKYQIFSPVFTACCWNGLAKWGNQRGQSMKRSLKWWKFWRPLWDHGNIMNGKSGKSQRYKGQTLKTLVFCWCRYVIKLIIMSSTGFWSWRTTCTHSLQLHRL